MADFLPFVAGLVCLAAATVLWRRKGRARRKLRLTAVLLVIGALPVLIGGGYWVWFTHRPQPPPTRQALFEGITYLRDVRSEPRPLVMHIVTVDLDAPDLGFVVTPGPPATVARLPLRARTTSAFLDEFDVQVAINGDFFTPFYFNSLLDYYPHEGDPVGVVGFASAEGVIYSRGWPHRPTLYLSPDNRAGMNQAFGPVYNAISGDFYFISRGQVHPPDMYRPYHLQPEPRAALGLDEAGRTLFLVAVDGRQPNYSEGLTVIELGEILREYGVYTAFNLDGGGSVTLVVEGADGRPMVLNSPIHGRVPGLERPVANHLGVRAARIASLHR